MIVGNWYNFEGRILTVSNAAAGGRKATPYLLLLGCIRAP